MDKIVKKKKSLTAKIKKLREEIKSQKEYYWELRASNNKARDVLKKLKQIIPLKYYRIEYKIKCNDGDIFKFTEVVKSYSSEMAIDELLIDKTHPDTFELIDIKLLA